MNMPSDPGAPLRVAVLSATLTIEPTPPDPLEVRVPVIRHVMPRITPALDGSYFRYRIDRDGGVHILAPIAGARICREKSPRRRPRSSARS